MNTPAPGPSVREHEYERLLAIRTRLRAFEHWSADRAAEHGLTGNQHQLLLAVRGHPGGDGPTVRQVSEYLFIRPNTAVELVNRVVALDLLARHGDPDDHRAVRLRLTAEGERRIQDLSAAHLEELARLAPLLEDLGAT
ncbi:hypothetical protein ASG90_17355 [Nocardioides sp. Soil797]|nr:hypothetical protein ASG90_17355 [Nocardioides sp. Soil797]